MGCLFSPHEPGCSVFLPWFLAVALQLENALGTISVPWSCFLILPTPQPSPTSTSEGSCHPWAQSQRKQPVFSLGTSDEPLGPPAPTDHGLSPQMTQKGGKVWAGSGGRKGGSLCSLPARKERDPWWGICHPQEHGLSPAAEGSWSPGGRVWCGSLRGPRGLQSWTHHPAQGDPLRPVTRTSPLRPSAPRECPPGTARGSAQQSLGLHRPQGRICWSRSPTASSPTTLRSEASTPELSQPNRLLWQLRAPRGRDRVGSGGN